LLEGLGTSHRNTKLLDIYEFPTGVLYHHDRPYMKLLRNKQIFPYGFHMCWTQGNYYYYYYYYYLILFLINYLFVIYIVIYYLLLLFHLIINIGKKDKLIYLRKALMWYLTDTCSPLQTLVEGGEIFNNFTSGMSSNNNEIIGQKKWKHLSSLCCTSMKDAP
jgi:hypothetical protein